MALLGQGSYRCLLQAKGGSPLLDELAWHNLSFSRRLDDISTASVVVGAGSSPSLGLLDAWSHEIAISRDDDEAWVGPIQTPQWEQETVSLQASDLFAWFERRLLDRHDRRWVGDDAGSVFEQIVIDALERDTSPNISLATSSTGVAVTRTILAAQRTRAADALRELARTALDFTALGRSIRAGGQEIPATAAFMLTDDTLLSPRLTSNGVDAATETTVTGAGSIAEMAGGPNALYGLVQQVYNEPAILDAASALANAVTRWQYLQVPPVMLTGVLGPEAPVDFADLVPGTRVTAKISGLDRQVDADFRLAQVDVRASASEQGFQEEVAVSLAPLGT